jgi:hypothetical protein
LGATGVKAFRKYVGEIEPSSQQLTCSHVERLAEMQNSTFLKAKKKKRRRNKGKK